MSAYTNICDPLVELHHLQFRERSVTRRWELALEKFGHFPNGALERQAQELAAERDSLRHAIAAVSAEFR